MLFISLCRQRNEPKKAALRSLRYFVCWKSLRKRTRISCSDSFCFLKTSGCTAFDASGTKAEGYACAKRVVEEVYFLIFFLVLYCFSGVYFSVVHFFVQTKKRTKENCAAFLWLLRLPEVFAQKNSLTLIQLLLFEDFRLHLVLSFGN